MGKKSETSLSEKLTVLVGKWAVRDGYHVMEIVDPHGFKSFHHIRETRYPPQIWCCPFQESAAAVSCSFWFGIYNDHCEEAVSLLTSLRTQARGSAQVYCQSNLSD